MLENNFSRIFLVLTCFRENDFPTIKIYELNVFMTFFGGNLFSRKLFCNHKRFQPKCFCENVWRKTCFRGKDILTIKLSTKTVFIFLLLGICFQENDFETIKMFD